MTELKKKGYKIEIKSWNGNFGNQLIQLSSAIKVSIETKSVLTYPASALIPNYQFDFRSKKNRQSNLKVTSNFFYHDECFQYPLIYDQERRDISIKYILPLIKENYQKIIGQNEPYYDYENTLILNIRSGDIFRDDYDSEEALKSGIRYYTQPPLAFYTKIINYHHKRNILIITQPDLRNPVINELLKTYKNITLKKHLHPIDDFMTLINAKYLVTCHSTFSWFGALMSKNLNTLYQPASFRVLGINDYEIYSYSFKDYIPLGAWKASQENLSKMIDLPLENVSAVFQKSNSFTDMIKAPKTICATTRFWESKSINKHIYVQSELHYFFLKLKSILRPRTRVKYILNKLGMQR